MPNKKIDVWKKLKAEAQDFIKKEPQLENILTQSIGQHGSFSAALNAWVVFTLQNESVSPEILEDVLDKKIEAAAAKDLLAILERDPACNYLLQAFLNFKGFKALLAYRLAHKLWKKGECLSALIIQGRISDLWDIDIHPAAEIGAGIMMDHAHSIVIGETARVGNDVTILHNVTLGGKGNDKGDRHPKIGDRVFIGTGAAILGNIQVGDDATIAAGSIVLQDVPPHTTAVGAPARIIQMR